MKGVSLARVCGSFAKNRSYPQGISVCAFLLNGNLAKCLFSLLIRVFYL